MNLTTLVRSIPKESNLESVDRKSRGDGGYQVCSALQDLAALRCDELRQRLREEARVSEAKAAVHAVGSELKGLLSHIQLLLLKHIVLFLEQLLHLKSNKLLMSPYIW